MMWAGPLLPVGFDPASKVKANVQLERLAARETPASERSPTSDDDEPMTWNGPPSPVELD